MKDLTISQVFIVNLTKCTKIIDNWKFIVLVILSIYFLVTLERIRLNGDIFHPQTSGQYLIQEQVRHIFWFLTGREITLKKKVMMINYKK